MVGTASAAITVYLNNNGNQPLNVGTLINTNTAEFSTTESDYCSGNTGPTAVLPGSNCNVNVTFTPNATGAQTGTITFPVTYADQTTGNFTLSMTGNGVATGDTVAITPAAVQFPAQIQSSTGSPQTITVTNTGNVSVNIGTDFISANSAEFEIPADQDGCTGPLAPTQSCYISVTFTPSSGATGAQTGTLKIADNATGGPHSVSLTGTAITAAQEIVLSQTALAFGNQPAGPTSSAQVVYFSNQGSTANVAITSFTLGGTNPTDFSIVTNTCSGYFYAQSSCYVSVQFNPLTGTSGALTATITEKDLVGTHTITLTGTAVAPGPAAALSPTTLAFPTQNVGTPSAAQNFSVTNTGSANLTITAVASTNTAEFPVYSDGCSGVTLAPPTGGTPGQAMHHQREIFTVLRWHPHRVDYGDR